MTGAGSGDPESGKEAAVNNATTTEEPKPRANGTVKGLNNFHNRDNEYIDAQSQIGPRDDDSESRDALARRDASEQRFLETESKIMEMLWSKYAALDIDALVTQFKSAFDRAEALGKVQNKMTMATDKRKRMKMREVMTWSVGMSQQLATTLQLQITSLSPNQ
ncbi:unnamed protein product [Merluccius merluccius]